MLDFYQHIPQYLDPIAFSIGSFAVRWYSLAYIAGFVMVFFLLRWRMEKGEASWLSDKGAQETIFNLLLTVFWGMLLGGRLGYVFFYDPGYYLQKPLEIFLPVTDTTEGFQVTGFYGMSYHGALIGAVVSGFIFSKIKKIDFWQLADFVAPAAAGAYFFGRIGNFLNGELYGRETVSFLGMYFGADGFLRHPSQLYEAFGEGVVLFFFLWKIRSRAKFKGQIFLWYVIGYALFRFILEYFRNPGEGEMFFWEFLSRGQVLSLVMFSIGIFLYFQKGGKNAIMQKR